MKYDDIDNFVDRLFDQGDDGAGPDWLPDQDDLYDEQDWPSGPTSFSSAATWQPAPPPQVIDYGVARYPWEEEQDGLACLAGYPENGFAPRRSPYADRDGIIRLPTEIAPPISLGEVFAWGALLLTALGILVALSESGLI